MTLEPSPGPPPAPVRRVPLPRSPVWVTYALLGVIGVVFGGQLLLAPFPGDFDPILQYGAKVNELIAAGEWWRLVTPIFIHGSILHFAFNAYALFNLGREIETFYGWGRFLLLFFFAGVCGTVASMLFSPAASVGASGAIFGLIGAEAVLLYRNRQMLGPRARAGLQNIALIALINLAIGLQPGSRIDNWGHLGGLAGGLALAWVLGPVWVAMRSSEADERITIIERPSGARFIGTLLLLAGLFALIVLAIGLQR